MELTANGLRLEWGVVERARHYIVKYVVRVPEGRYLVQKEVSASDAYINVQRAEMPGEPLMHLIAEVTAHCEGKTSSPAVIQLALVSRLDACEFGAHMPAWKADSVTWRPVGAAQSYLVCAETRSGDTTCQETAGTEYRAAAGETRLVTLTPVCNKAAGRTVFVPVASTTAVQTP